MSHYLMDRLMGTAGTEDSLAVQIPRLAYAFWEGEGRPHGRDLIHWHRACWALDPFPEPPPAEIEAEIPEFQAAMQAEEDERAAWERANYEDAPQRPPSIAAAMDQAVMAEGQGNAPAAALLDGVINRLSDALHAELDAKRRAEVAETRTLKPVTVAEFLKVRRALDYSRADAVDEVFRYWSETGHAELLREIEAAWPWEAAPLEAQIAFIETRHAAGAHRDSARAAFMAVHAHPTDADRQDYALDRFNRTWDNARRRASRKRSGR